MPKRASKSSATPQDRIGLVLNVAHLDRADAGAPPRGAVVPRGVPGAGLRETQITQRIAFEAASILRAQGWLVWTCPFEIGFALGQAPKTVRTMDLVAATIAWRKRNQLEHALILDLHVDTGVGEYNYLLVGASPLSTRLAGALAAASPPLRAKLDLALTSGAASGGAWAMRDLAQAVSAHDTLSAIYISCGDIELESQVELREGAGPRMWAEWIGRGVAGWAEMV